MVWRHWCPNECGKKVFFIGFKNCHWHKPRIGLYQCNKCKEEFTKDEIYPKPILQVTN